MKEIIESWDEKAAKWKSLIGLRGDNNRFFNSDPVLWDFIGPISGQTVLDAGCGTGYLSILLTQKSAKVIGIDISQKMIDAANSNAKEVHQQIDFRTESCSELLSIPDSSTDIIVSNYVIMDTPDLEKTIQNFYRVLRPEGKAVLVFSHPCYNQLEENEMYFDEMKKTERWGPFDSDFIYFHRPLSRYWKTFTQAGFKIENFDEPLAKDPFAPGFKEEWRKTYRKRPYSVAFLLRK